MVLDLMRLQAARGRLIARNAEYLSLDQSVGQFALDLAGEKLQESGVDEVLDPDDYANLTETVAIAIATGMHVALEATGSAGSAERVTAMAWVAPTSAAHRYHIRRGRWKPGRVVALASTRRQAGDLVRLVALDNSLPDVHLEGSKREGYYRLWEDPPNWPDAKYLGFVEVEACTDPTCTATIAVAGTEAPR
jgi:hypothetical protein